MPSSEKTPKKNPFERYGEDMITGYNKTGDFFTLLRACLLVGYVEFARKIRQKWKCLGKKLRGKGSPPLDQRPVHRLGISSRVKREWRDNFGRCFPLSLYRVRFQSPFHLLFLHVCSHAGMDPLTQYSQRSKNDRRNQCRGGPG